MNAHVDWLTNAARYEALYVSRLFRFVYCPAFILIYLLVAEHLATLVVHVNAKCHWQTATTWTFFFSDTNARYRCFDVFSLICKRVLRDILKIHSFSKKVVIQFNFTFKNPFKKAFEINSHVYLFWNFSFKEFILLLKFFISFEI